MQRWFVMRCLLTLRYTLLSIYKLLWLYLGCFWVLEIVLSYATSALCSAYFLPLWQVICNNLSSGCIKLGLLNLGLLEKHVEEPGWRSRTNHTFQIVSPDIVPILFAVVTKACNISVNSELHLNSTLNLKLKASLNLNLNLDLNPNMRLDEIH